MLVTSIFSFSHSVFYLSQTNFRLFIYIILLSANAFSLDQSKILLFGKQLNPLFIEHGSNQYQLSVTGVLDEGDEETLVNVNMMDLEKAEKNTELKKKKPDYNPYDEGDVDEYGLVIC